jgi:ketosteroid isomerase-like protein
MDATSRSTDSEARTAARRWKDTWARAWPAKDVEAIAELYAPEADFRSHPFREPEDAREYVRRVFAEEESEAECRFSEPLVDGDRAAVEYRAVLVYEGTEATLAGTTLLRFRADGLVVEHRDYWALEQGRR